MEIWKHFKTITKHKLLVMQGCFKVGLYWQGITHDLSKYTPTEFLNGIKYFQGTRSEGCTPSPALQQYDG